MPVLGASVLASCPGVGASCVSALLVELAHSLVFVVSGVGMPAGCVTVGAASLLLSVFCPCVWHWNEVWSVRIWASCWSVCKDAPDRSCGGLGVELCSEVGAAVAAQPVEVFKSSLRGWLVWGAMSGGAVLGCVGGVCSALANVVASVRAPVCVVLPQRASLRGNVAASS